MEYSKHDYSRWMVINKSIQIDYNSLVVKLAHLNQLTELQRINLDLISASVRSQLLDFGIGDSAYLQILKTLSVDLITTSNAVKFACWYGYYSSITFLSSMDLDFTGGLSNAASKGYFNIVEMLYTKARDVKDAVFEAALHNHIDIVQFFINQDVDPEYLNNALITAVINRHVDIIQLLLKDERADPTFNNHTALFYSCECGFVDIVRILLLDTRVLPSACENKAVKLARRNKHETIVEMIEQDPRYEPEIVETKYYRLKMKFEKIKQRVGKCWQRDIVNLFALFQKY
ncbi:hypothetical protein HDV04_000375 [Boothiomyces sp. JEL0838]|nr:hypothetical protein HDV04_000375 [Boothiomyces sp. JEL0838]